MAEPASDATAEGAVSPIVSVEVSEAQSADTEQDDWKKKARHNERELNKALAELEKSRQASMSEQEKAVAEAKVLGRSEAAAEIRLERVRDKIEAKAAGKMADPEDAAALLGDLAQFIENDGQIDSKGIASAIDHLIETKPYLTAQPGNGSAEGGARGEPAKSLAGDALTDALTRAVGAPRSTR